MRRHRATCRHDLRVRSIIKAGVVVGRDIHIASHAVFRGDNPLGDNYSKRIVALNSTGRPWIARSIADVGTLGEPAPPEGDSAGIDEDWLCASGD